jgi:hypothetical protein
MTKNTDKELSMLKEQVKQLQEQVEKQKKDYEALKRGKYVIGNSFGGSKEPVYSVHVTEWDGITGNGFMTIYTFERMAAKIVELALKKVFPGCQVETRRKKDVYSDENTYSQL